MGTRIQSVRELARRLGVSDAEVLRRARQLGIPATNLRSGLWNGAEDRLRRSIARQRAFRTGGRPGP